MDNVVEKKSFEFAVEVVKLTRGLRKSHDYELASQLLRSATSVGANIAEAQYAQSRRDFASKMSIARKEANESLYWLRLMLAAGIIETAQSKPRIDEAMEIIRLLTSIIKSSTLQTTPETPEAINH